MQQPTCPDDEPQRIEALYSCCILDTPAEERFDRITRLARTIFKTRIALISLVDTDRQWFKSRQGLEVAETSRDISFCGHAILNRDIFVIPDALEDERFVDNPLVTGEPNIRFYAGAPITSREGYRIGTLCIIDDRPRQFNDEELASLRDLADCVQDELLLQQQQLHQDALLVLTRIISLHDDDTPTQLRRALALGCEYLGMPFGIISRIQGDSYEICFQQSPEGTLQDGQRFPLGDTYCNITLQADDVVAFARIDDTPHAGHPCYSTIKLKSYIGIPLYIENRRYGTLNFSSPEPLNQSRFSDTALEFIRLLGGWVESRLQRWQLDQSLRRSEARLRGLFELSPIGIALNDFETGAFIETNDSLIRPTGYTREEFVQLSYWDITPRQYEQEEAEQLEKLRTTGQYGPYEKEYIRKDGSRYPVVLRGILLDDPSGRKLIWSIIEDVSEMKRKEDELREINQRFLLAADAAQFGVWDLDLNTDNLKWDDWMFRIYGIPRDQFSSAYEAWESSVHPDDLEHAKQEVEQAIKGEKAFDTEFRICRPDGDIRDIKANAVIVRNAEDRPTHMVGINYDITEHKRAERLKNEFVSTVSHELRTPLTSISGSLGLLVEGTVGELPPQAQELVNIACNNSKRLSLLINDLLDMEKLAAGKIELDLQAHALQPLLKQSIEANRAYAARFEVVLALTESLPQVSICVDENRFMQIMANLLSNAAKFSPAGSVVKIAMEIQDQDVHISVTDQGPGIPPDFQSRIFQKFAQADASSTRQKGGTGLGLAVTRELVERMHGTIRFETSTSGTTFTVAFPVQPEP